MIRTVIRIDKEKCNGCGLCVKACHEGAIGLVDNKATLLRDDYCDGLGDCLPACPTNAISFEKREALAYDEEAVKLHLESMKQKYNWPIQIKLAPTKSNYYNAAKLLIAASCTAFSYKEFHEDFMKGKVTLIGCPKLDGVDYSEKLSMIIKENEISEIYLARMEVPCCRGLELALNRAIALSGKSIKANSTIIKINR